MSFTLSSEMQMDNQQQILTEPLNMPSHNSSNLNNRRETLLNHSRPLKYDYNVTQDATVSPDISHGFNGQTSMHAKYSTSKIGFETYGTPKFATNLMPAQPLVTNMAFQYGTTLVGSSKDQIEKYVSSITLRYYFAVDVDYVQKKLVLLIFPFTHKDWSIKYKEDTPLQPRFEKNAPDLYIPTMAFLTYILMSGMILGSSDKFNPEQLSSSANLGLVYGIIELLIHWLTMYIMNIETSLKTLDLLAYAGYKFVGINAALVSSMILKRWGYYFALIYVSMCLSFFLMRSLRIRVFSQGNCGYSAIGQKRRLYFILYFSLLQPLLMWWLTYHLV